jgi:hypothetical protein
MYSMNDTPEGVGGVIRRILGNRVVMCVGAALLIGRAAGLGNLATRTATGSAAETESPEVTISTSAPTDRGTSPFVSTTLFEGPIRSFPAGRELGELEEFALATTDLVEEVTYGNARGLEVRVVIENQLDGLVRLDGSVSLFFAETAAGANEGRVTTGDGFLPPVYRAMGTAILFFLRTPGWLNSWSSRVPERTSGTNLRRQRSKSHERIRALLPLFRPRVTTRQGFGSTFPCLKASRLRHSDSPDRRLAGRFRERAGVDSRRTHRIRLRVGWPRIAKRQDRSGRARPSNLGYQRADGPALAGSF